MSLAIKTNKQTKQQHHQTTTACDCVILPDRVDPVWLTGTDKSKNYPLNVRRAATLPTFKTQLKLCLLNPATPAFQVSAE